MNRLTSGTVVAHIRTFLKFSTGTSKLSYKNYNCRPWIMQTISMSSIMRRSTWQVGGRCQWRDGWSRGVTYATGVSVAGVEDAGRWETRGNSQERSRADSHQAASALSKVAAGAGLVAAVARRSGGVTAGCEVARSRLPPVVLSPLAAPRPTLALSTQAQPQSVHRGTLIAPARQRTRQLLGCPGNSSRMSPTRHPYCPRSVSVDMSRRWT